MDKYYIVRTENAGVFFAQVEKLDGQTIVDVSGIGMVQLACLS